MKARVLASATILAAALISGPTAQARRATTAEPPERVEPTGTWASGTQPERACGRVRRKLWLPQEGWIVRTVPSCR